MANAVETPSQNNLMTEGSIVKSLLLFALPLIFGNLLQQLYNTADSIIVGNFVGANALAAVGLQRQLNRITKDYPFLGKLTVDGVFGSRMAATVRAFQKQFNLTADGVVGRQIP